MLTFRIRYVLLCSSHTEKSEAFHSDILLISDCDDGVIFSYCNLSRTELLLLLGTIGTYDNYLDVRTSKIKNTVDNTS